MLTRTLHRHGCHSTFQNLQQSLLHALTGHISRNRRVLAALTRYLVDFVNIDDALLRSRHIAVSGLYKPLQYGFHIVAHIPRFSECGGVGDDERHIHDLRQCLCKIRFAHAGRPQQQDIRFGHLHAGQWIVARMRRTIAQCRGFTHFHIDALVMVIYGHGKRSFSGFLPDHVVVEIGADLCGFRQLQCVQLGVFDTFFGNDVDAQFDAFVANGRT